MLTEHTGDVFSHIDKPTVIMHGCNMLGVMGAGIAYTVKKFFPYMFKDYQEICLSGKATLGGVYIYKINSKLWIANAFTQETLGDADKEAIKNAIKTVSSVFSPNIELRSVRIGCGLGGLSWSEIKPLFEESERQWNIYELN